MRRGFVALILSAALTLGACGGGEADPASTIKAYVVEYNAGSIDGVMALFSEESVVTGHPFDASSTGLAEIRAVQVADMAQAASEKAHYTISNVEVTGNRVTWDGSWISSAGVEFCESGHSAVVEDGLILSWTWPGGGFGCP